MAGGPADGFEQTMVSDDFQQIFCLDFFHFRKYFQDSNGSDDYDMDVFREFFQVENGT